MNTHFECIPCALNSYLRLCDTAVVPESKKELILRELLAYLSEADYDLSPPVMGQKLHQIIRKALNNPDPYKDIKRHFNQKLMDLLPRLEEKIQSSKDMFDTALRLAIAGNVIDFGAKYQYDIAEAIDNIMKKEITLDHSSLLKQAIRDSNSLLYIGDNCGEIVMDKLFLQHIDIAEKYFVVRGGPVINDITIEDAEMLGIDEQASIITTGSDTPGAVWETASEEFREKFQKADLVISKGQGNLEGLIDIPHPNIFFLLVSKCELIGQLIGSRKGEYIVMKGGETQHSATPSPA